MNQKNLMAMDGLSKWRNELKYRGFMARLSDQITAQDLEKLKYMLTSLIPDGKMESLDTAIKLFRYLERMLFVEPNNLGNLEELFRVMGKVELCQMIAKFTHDRNTRTIESFRIRNEDVQKTEVLVSDPA